MGCVITGKHRRWPNGEIPYEINDDLGSQERSVIDGAISEWNTRTVITLMPRNGEDDYVEFVRGDECKSKVGRRGGKQPITCSFQSEGTVVHEIGHAVGLWHEQSRQDRDLFIVVHLENVEPGKLGNFEKHIDDGLTVGSYDYASVMHYTTRQRHVDWRPGSVIEGQKSKAPPALAEFNNELHMVHLGKSSNDIWWSIWNGELWNKPDGTLGDERIPGQRSKAPPALAVFNNQLHMVHLGDSSNNIWWSIYDGASWNKPDGTPGNERIPGQRSKAPPALAAFNNQLHMVHLGDSSNDIWWSIYDGTSWNKPDGTPGDERIPAQRSKAPPALAVFDNQLHMVHLGDSSNEIWWSIYDGASWNKPDGTPGNERIPGQRSKASPALTVFNNQLRMVHLGDTSNNIWTSVNENGDWKANRRKYHGSSRAGPVMAARGGNFYMLHVGEESDRIYQTLFDISQLAIEPPPPPLTLGSNRLSNGDVQTVAEVYA